MTTNQSLPEKKYTSIAYLLWGLGLFGICGLHRMYLGQYRLGITMLLTFGVCGLAQFIDIAVIPKATSDLNAKNSITSGGNAIGKPVSHNVREDRVPTENKQPRSEDLDEWDLEQASIEETMKKLRD